jgi:hypothetical protein
METLLFIFNNLTKVSFGAQGAIEAAGTIVPIQNL